MICENIQGFHAALPPFRAIMGLDLGDKTIGVAISDLRRMVATPLLIIRRVKFSADANRLLALFSERAVAGILLGLPLVLLPIAIHLLN